MSQPVNAVPGARVNDRLLCGRGKPGTGQDGRSFTAGFRSPFSASSYAAHSTP